MKCVCCVCNRKEPEKLIDPDTEYDVRAEQTGFAPLKRSQGGVNGLKMRTPTGRYAHGRCVDQESGKINANQGGLFA